MTRLRGVNLPLSAALYLSFQPDTIQTNNNNDDDDDNKVIKKKTKQKQQQPQRFREKKRNNPQQIKAKSIAKGRDPLISLNMNLDYLAKTGAARRAEALLMKIEQLFDEG